MKGRLPLRDGPWALIGIPTGTRRVSPARLALDQPPEERHAGYRKNDGWLDARKDSGQTGSVRHVLAMETWETLGNRLLSHTPCKGLGTYQLVLRRREMLIATVTESYIIEAEPQLLTLYSTIS